MEQGGKLYTQLKIDEISNLGAAKIQLEKLKGAIGADVSNPQAEEPVAKKQKQPISV